MGALSALVASHAGAEVIVTGLSADKKRLDLLSDIGLKTMVVGEDESIISELVDDLDRDGFDLTVEATGVPDGVETAIKTTRDGGNVVVVGIISGDVDVNMASLVRSEIQLRTSHGAAPADFLAAMELLRDGRIPVKELIDQSYTPESPSDAFDAFASAKTIKPVFDLEELA
jgi:threonine dehydrogenase-like Zn-dependent dehydrogenase